MNDKLILYGHHLCPNIPPVVGVLAQSKVEYKYINIRRDPEAAARVREINNGYESVPTIVFPDGSTLTEPSIKELKARLEALGYRVGPAAWVAGNLWLLLFILLILIAIVRGIWVS